MCEVFAPLQPKQKSNEVAEALFKLADNPKNIELDRKRFEVMLRKEERDDERNEREKMKTPYEVELMHHEKEREYREN
jgi:hypothetical protein